MPLKLKCEKDGLVLIERERWKWKWKWGIFVSGFCLERSDGDEVEMGFV